MDVDGIEQVNLPTLGGADMITINDLSRTGVHQVNLDLSGVPGGGKGDGQVDINGTADRDVIAVVSGADGISVVSRSVRVNISGAEAAPPLPGDPVG
jgi:hypothetical protein